MKKLIITGDFAHFKSSSRGKVQNSYKIPPISTVIGVLKNIYGKEISNFNFGYIFSYKSVFTDLQKIYKEINLSEKSEKARMENNKWINDVCLIQYLSQPRLVIYTDIDKEEQCLDFLNLGKTDCPAKLTVRSIGLKNKIGTGFNQLTPVNIGNGAITRIATETMYNYETGFYNINTTLVRFNKEILLDKNYDFEEEQNIFMWQYKGFGEIHA